MKCKRGRPKKVNGREKQLHLRLNYEESYMLDRLSDMMNISKQELIRAFIRDHYGTAFNFSRPSEEYEYDYYVEDEDDFE